MSRTRVIMLGTGTPNAEASRVSAGVVVTVDSQPYLIDCGHGIVQRVVQAHQSGRIAWDTRALTHLFVTHLHADHVVGLPDLMFTPWIHGRTKKVQAYGPAELRSMVDYLLLAFHENIQEHIAGHPIDGVEGYQVDVHTVTEGQCYVDDRVTVFALGADHGTLTAYSYKLITPDKTIVISGDTKPVPAFVDWAKDCDILIHEVYSSEMFKNRSREWQAYHSQVHTSTDELADLANQIQPDLLVLYHQLFWGATPEQICAEIAASYSGRVVSAKDLDIF